MTRKLVATAIAVIVSIPLIPLLRNGAERLTGTESPMVFPARGWTLDPEVGHQKRTAFTLSENQYLTIDTSESMTSVRDDAARIAEFLGRNQCVGTATTTSPMDRATRLLRLPGQASGAHCDGAAEVMLFGHSDGLPDDSRIALAIGAPSQRLFVFYSSHGSQVDFENWSAKRTEISVNFSPDGKALVRTSKYAGALRTSMIPKTTEIGMSSIDIKDAIGLGGTAAQLWESSKNIASDPAAAVANNGNAVERDLLIEGTQPAIGLVASADLPKAAAMRKPHKASKSPPAPQFVLIAPTEGASGAASPIFSISNIGATSPAISIAAASPTFVSTTIGSKLTWLSFGSTSNSVYFGGSTDGTASSPFSVGHSYYYFAQYPAQSAELHPSSVSLPIPENCASSARAYQALAKEWPNEGARIDTTRLVALRRVSDTLAGGLRKASGAQEATARSALPKTQRVDEGGWYALDVGGNPRRHGLVEVEFAPDGSGEHRFFTLKDSGSGGKQAAWIHFREPGSLIVRASDGEASLHGMDTAEFISRAGDMTWSTALLTFLLVKDIVPLCGWISSVWWIRRYAYGRISQLPRAQRKHARDEVDLMLCFAKWSGVCGMSFGPRKTFWLAWASLW